MLVFALNPGHDGAAAVVADGRLLLSLEAEKDSFPRHAGLSSSTLLLVADRIGALPDVIAHGGWQKAGRLGDDRIGAGYLGAQAVLERPAKFFGKPVTVFSSSHERSHIAMAIGMAPRDDAPLRAVLVWEGALGHLYLVDQRGTISRRIEVLNGPGKRFAFLYALADPTFPESRRQPRLEDSGKLMALAAFGEGADADSEIIETVDRILAAGTPVPLLKQEFSQSPLFNAGVESDLTKIAAALVTERIFEMFAAAAQEHLPRDIPLHISGGCGLNCDWNVNWRELGHFSSVFVPPCTDDSGSAIGTALDALAVLRGDPHISWNVYNGLEFEWDCEPDPARWKGRALEVRLLADALAGGRIAAWVQGRWEIGPRALGNRSLLAEPFSAGTRERLNELKQREGYRPIAPCCRIEDAGKAFDSDFEDPYMLYFRTVRSRELGAITHVDGSARVQTVTKQSNAPLHSLLSAFAARSGCGVLCNTSLNFKRFGFINRMSDLVAYAEARGLDDIVVGDRWFQRGQN